MCVVVVCYALLDVMLRIRLLSKMFRMVSRETTMVALVLLFAET